MIGLSIFFNILPMIAAAVGTAIFWNDPSLSFWVGANMVVAIWSFFELIRDLARI